MITVFDMQRELELYVKSEVAEGKTEERVSTLNALVKDGILTLNQAAKRAGMTPEAFQQKAMSLTEKC